MTFLTLLFVLALALVSLYITLSVRRDFNVRERAEREQSYLNQRAGRARRR
ncbi:MAG TPA: hypothetical protein VFA21_01065 [Pyrinomonadaceae bacterium]|nr:hypothetical protein [Pyrinomonadaceae bacterium]